MIKKYLDKPHSPMLLSITVRVTSFMDANGSHFWEDSPISNNIHDDNTDIDIITSDTWYNIELLNIPISDRIGSQYKCLLDI